MSGSRRVSGDESTRQTTLPTPTPTPDEQATRPVEDVGIVAELKAVGQTGAKKSLPLYAMPDQIVVGRGTASDWQIDDDSLSRKHAQLKWNGRELTVEDLGSANGTRVGARAARMPTPVKPGDTIQLGTVMVTFELRGQAAAAAGPDGDATRLVAAPAPSPSETGSSPLPPFIAAPTVIRAEPPVPAPDFDRGVEITKPQAAVFRPERNLARADERTQPWDPRAALVHPPEKALDTSELMERLRAAWRTNRRPFVMAGAAVWVGILLVVWQIFTRPPPEDDAPSNLPSVSARSGVSRPSATENPANPIPDTPVVNPNPNPANAVPNPLPVDDNQDHEQQLADAVSAYDQGRLTEALTLFKKLAAADPKDAAARFMVELIEQRVGPGQP